ncbi:hypothetical protein JOB18_041096 [Solea senegalensis]|uniref:Uncharacterized protein n=1 Tax=Solea senegalensis TaxID=28829 RepID=A0AAV6SBB3_SOLSE|nr:hypothetical protein JOB18_041096 [Solea senegalensis]
MLCLEDVSFINKPPVETALNVELNPEIRYFLSDVISNKEVAAVTSSSSTFVEVTEEFSKQHYGTVLERRMAAPESSFMLRSFKTQPVSFPFCVCERYTEPSSKQVTAAENHYIHTYHRISAHLWLQRALLLLLLLPPPTNVA